MRLAIFHNYMDNIGGAEMVALTLAKDLNGDIYTTNINRDKIAKMGFSDINIESIGTIPNDAPMRQQMALKKFKNFHAKDYDFVVIDGDWAVSGAVKNKPNLWYCHSPIREIWDLYGYTRSNITGLPGKLAFDAWVRYNRYLSRKYVKHIDKIIVNSRNVQNRVKKYYDRDSIVVNPPIDTEQFHCKKFGNYWLAVNRLINHKRVELQIKAFRRMPKEKLIIVGSYEDAVHFNEYTRYIQDIKPDNVQIVSHVSRKELIDYYANCKGFITTSMHEDFGMTAVEAMASGKPVVAVNEGGYKETVIDGVTGMLVDPDHTEIMRAVKEIGQNPKKYKNACIKQAAGFDRKIFVKRMKEEIEDTAKAVVTKI